ncbi:MAG TPA: DMT family transporter [Nocardioidaceae bacterium]|nr:DMT family transporter [Nocardioidaceae bacterium]
MPRNPSYGVTLVLLGAGLFIVNAGVSRVALRAGVDASVLTTVRVTGTLAVLLLIAALVRREALNPPRGRLAVLVVAHGLVGVAALQWTYFVAIERLPVGMALLLEYQAPILVALWARFVQHEHVHSRMWLGLGLALAGLAAATEIWNGLQFDGLGVVAGLAAAVCFAAYFLIGEVGVNAIDPLRVIIWSFAVAAVSLNLVAPVTRVGDLGVEANLLGRLGEHSVALWIVLAWVVVLGTVIPFASELLALQHLRATTVTTIAMLEPVGAVGLGWLWFRESLGVVALIGCLAVVAGILLAQTARRTAVLEPIAT